MLYFDHLYMPLLPYKPSVAPILPSFQVHTPPYLVVINNMSPIISTHMTDMGVGSSTGAWEMYWQTHPQKRMPQQHSTNSSSAKAGASEPLNHPCWNSDWLEF